MKEILFVFLCSLMLVSCEQDADVDIPYVEPKLVISCFITPQDSFIRAKISKSSPVFNSNTNVSSAPVTNAVVTLFGNSSSTPLVYNSSTTYYEADPSVFPIIGGNEYKIVVTHPNGERAEAITTVPLVSPANFQCTATDSLYSSDPFYQNGECRFSYSFNDPAGTQNYYRLMYYGIHLNTFSGDSTLQRYGYDLFSDDNADGTTIAKASTAYYYVSIGGGDSLVGYELWLASTNYDYQRFHISLDNYSGGGDPFSEPILIYSNIEGGFGIFAAANSTKLRIPR